LRVFVTGATGLVGRSLVPALRRAGHEVVALSRRPAPEGLRDATAVQGDPTTPGPWQETLAGCDACVNLAGEPIAAGRWNEERKRRIHDSRLRAAENVAAILAKRGPRVLVHGSAIGYYGSRGEEDLTESSSPGSDSLARSCVAHEAAAQRAGGRARVVLLRTGIVLARDGGALPRMALPFRFFAGGPIGDGAFWQSWIHLDDEVGLILAALGDERYTGPLNAVAPAPTRNRELARAIGAALHRPSFLPTPPAAIRLAVGGVAEVVMASQRVLPRRALGLGFAWSHPEVREAVASLLRPDPE